jgi:hypothetical protein
VPLQGARCEVSAPRIRLRAYVPHPYPRPVLGWIADSFRFAWALLYWNVRKSWFQFRRGRVACPCQSPSDSGRAYETRCDACWNWHNQARFQRVCPLLVPTKDGLRCSVDAANVRPFWGKTVRYYGGTFLGIYAALVLSVFTFLRTVGYPVSIVHVALPPLWHRVGQTRGWFFLMRAQKAFAAGRTNEGLLYLENSYEFDPENYDAGLALAKAYQLGQPSHSDQIFARLMRDHPEQRETTAQNWFRALLARGEFDQVVKLSGEEVLRDAVRANAWMRALVFATRQTNDAAALQQLLSNHTEAATRWRTLIETELAWRDHNTDAVRASLARTWPGNSPPYTVVYRVELMTALGDPVSALDFLEQQRRQLDDEAYVTLRLHCLAEAGAQNTLHNEVSALILGPPLSPPRIKILCAQLIRHPDAALFEELCAKVGREVMPFNDVTAGGWFTLVCTAGAVGDLPQMHALALRLRQTPTPFAPLLLVEAFFRGETADRRATSFLPFLPVPIEIDYALIDRFPGPRVVAGVSAPKAND